MSGNSSARISVERFNEILAQTTPATSYLGIRAERILVGEAWSRISYSPAALRAGGVYSGPALMALIDVCMYAAVLGTVGEDPRPLTSNVSVDFLRRSPECDLIAHCKLLSRDADLVVGTIVVAPESDEEKIVCRSTCSYALPPPERG